VGYRGECNIDCCIKLRRRGAEADHNELPRFRVQQTPFLLRGANVDLGQWSTFSARNLDAEGERLDVEIEGGFAL
jgi:hypothetical protein